MIREVWKDREADQAVELEVGGGGGGGSGGWQIGRRAGAEEVRQHWKTDWQWQHGVTSPRTRS